MRRPSRLSRGPARPGDRYPERNRSVDMLPPNTHPVNTRPGNVNGAAAPDAEGRLAALRREREAKRTGVRLASLSCALRSRGWEPGKLAGWGQAALTGYHTRLCRSGVRTANLPLAAASMELLYAHRPDTV